MIIIKENTDTKENSKMYSAVITHSLIPLIIPLLQKKYIETHILDNATS
nr:MAG TPA: hypothetical protein [Caudoviricetes sp.]